MEAKTVQFGTCTEKGCLIHETGKCALSKVPTECEFYSARVQSPAKAAIGDAIAEDIPEDSTLESAPDVDEPRRFYSGRELGRIDSLPLTHSDYSKLIGVFGRSEVGKTTFLISLYLQALHGLLPANNLFAGSLTWRAFEQRVRHIRRWQGDPMFPVDHTRRKDPRQPALLHLALKRDSVRHDLLLTDYPGEWTKRVAETKSFADRLRFIKSAHGILLVLDGVQFSDNAERHAEAELSRMFLDRLVTDIQIDAPSTPLAVLITKSDTIEMSVPESAERVTQHAQQLGFPAKLISVASFSNNPALINHGAGVFAAIEYLLDFEVSKTVSNPSEAKSSRAFHRFRV